MSSRSQWRRFNESLEAEEQEPERADQTDQLADERKTFAGRVRFLVLLFAIFGLVVLTRLLLSQVIGGNSDTDRVLAQTVDTSRGRIVDSNGLLLAMDTFSWEIYVDPQLAEREQPNAEEISEYAALIGGITPAALTEALSESGTVAVVARGVTEQQCLTASNHADIPRWIWCDGKRKRLYPHSSLAAHVLGYVDADQNGSAGIEASYDGWLRTTGTWASSRLPGSPQPLPETLKTYLPSAGGRDLVLNLNAALQYRVEQALAAALIRYEAKSGTIIVMDPRTGAMLALANLPTFDPNNLAQFTQGEWKNIAINEFYEPGSVFKPITYAAAVDSGRLSPDEMLYDDGSLSLDGQTITNAESLVYGRITASQALAKSVNVVAAKLCLDMGSDTFYRYVRQFGFGKVTEADSDMEIAGIVKWPGTKYWSRYDQAANSFGQGISVTPLQMANAIAAIANGGNLMQPQFVQGLVYDGQLYALPPRMLGRAIKPETARSLTEMMTFTVDSYALGPTLVPGYRVAGKTGTAEVPGSEGYTSSLTITSFVGFLPAAKPQLLVLVKLAEPKNSRWAEQVALPVFSEVAQDAVEILKIAPDDRLPQDVR